jgi:glycosyltransferase involved in cell wall biosynthesis
MKGAPVLSICIPTWNHAPSLEKLLLSIEEQWRDGIELVIADNGSTDETGTLIRRFREGFEVTYSRAPRNQGFDANLRRCVTSARGAMCWIIGDDDRVYPGAISRVLDTIQNCPGALLVGDVVTETRDGKPVKEEPSTAWPDYSTFWLDEPGSIARYLSRALTVRAGFPFIANVVFPRAQWLATQPEQWHGTSFTHLFACWRMALDGIPVVTRRKAFVFAGIGNHCWRDGDTARQALHVVQTSELLARMVPSGKDREALRCMWSTWYTPSYLETVHERCKREPVWPFIRLGLERMARGGLGPEVNEVKVGAVPPVNARKKKR